MFKKLRNRFLIVNLVTISVIMLVAFAAIYVIMYRDVQGEINMDLYRISDSYGRESGKYLGPRMGGADSPLTPAAGELPDKGGKAYNPPERFISFMVQTDKEWKLTGKESRFEIDTEFYALALAEAVAENNSRNKDTGQFTLDGNHWIYTVQPNDEGYKLVFLDITAQQEILTKLIYTFTVVGLAMLIILFFTSRFFANRSIRPVREAFNKQKQFIADASHELKTPLTIINTNADVLLSNREDTIHNQSKWLHYIKSETERMTKLTNDLLYLTEMDDSRTGMVAARFNLSEAVENIILTMEAVIYEKNIALDYHIQPGLTVQGNSQQLQQVVMILLDNAVKYTNPKGAVTLSLTRQHNDVVLSVTNTGEGIAPEHLTRIFDRFYRTDASRARKQGGYGLGLAIAKSIVDQHKGRIYAKSVVGESATFYVQLG
ncbi:sensor histidine kinase [Paenibacillus donghaensis]|uniref:histidine kinase n=1 Tax=Paenibacillus donghaensis TaxID=414771 RepID=A0A2Z2KUJ6_9BACL|nr:HAMP domain-containing sensor histidine kinase [Paenibacillus donghaensis]ASA24751.1 two-component sensor histidine kinase [Paenibacillus donghaensis]